MLHLPPDNIIRYVLDITLIAVTFLTACKAEKIAKVQDNTLKNSYKPICDICFIISKSSVSLRINNNGNGALMIDKIEYIDIIQNKEIKDIEKYFGKIELDYHSISAGARSIAPSKSFALFKIKLKGLKKTERHILKRKINALKVIVSYSDMYEKQKVDTSIFSKLIKLLKSNKNDNNYMYSAEKHLNYEKLF